MMINNKVNREKKERERLRENNNVLLQYYNKQNIKCCRICKSYIFCIYTT